MIAADIIASIREVADEYPAEVGNSALLAEWVDWEVVR